MKTAKGPNPEEQKQQYYEICSTIVPMISEAIDQAGGFCSLGEVSKDQGVIQAMEVIPAGFSKKIKNVIDLFPDFISYFDGGRVATAKGYENGLVNADGTINNVKKPKKGEQPRAEVVAAVQQAVQNVYSTEETETKGKPEVTVHCYGMMGKKLQEACMHGSDAAFAAVMEEARIYRYNQSPNAQEEAKRIIVDCVQSIVGSGKKPTLNVLTSNQAVIDLQPVTGRKLKKFLEEHADTFIIREVPHENGGPHKDLVVDVNQAFFSRPAHAVHAAAPRAPNNFNKNQGARPAAQQQGLKAPLAAPAVQGGKGAKQQTQAVVAPQIYRPAANGFVGGKGKGKGKGMDSAAKRVRVA